MALTNNDKKFIAKLFDEERKYTKNLLAGELKKERKHAKSILREELKEERKLTKILVEDVVEEKLDLKIKKYVGNLPTKDEFNSRMDELMGELKTHREEKEILSQHSADHSAQIKKLEKIHPNYSHSHIFA